MADWTRAREYSTRFEAEMAQALLESNHIPATIRSHAGGIFGAGVQGMVPEGLQLLVPSDRLEKAQGQLEDVDEDLLEDE